MPRRTTHRTSLPRRPDPRRPGGNAIDAQHAARRERPGQLEAIAERRVLALELRKAGSSYRQIATALAIDTHTAWADVASELAAIRELTVEQAQEVRALEIGRLDAMVAGLWPQVRAGSPPAVTAAVRVCERRSRLLGLDAPVVTKSEHTGSLGIYSERLAAERELFSKLSVEQLEELAAESQRLVDRAAAMVQANVRPILVGISSSPAAGVGEVTAGEPADQSPTRTVSKQEEAPPDHH